MQRESTRRGFSVNHQKVALEIDFSGSLQGFTEITIVPNIPDLRTVHLHARHCKISSIKIDGHTAGFLHHDPLSNLTVSKPDEFNVYPELKRRLYSALSESDEGELSIAIPSQVPITLVHPAAAATATTVNANANANPNPNAAGSGVVGTLGSGQHQHSKEYTPIVIRIEYSLKDPEEGIQFVIPSQNYPYRVPHVYTTPSSPDAARCWIPCVDNLWERCTWEFEFVVPRSLDVDGESSTGPNYNVVVVCSGEFQQQIVHPLDPTKVIFLFEQQALTSVQHITFVAGPFYVMPMSSNPAPTNTLHHSRIVDQNLVDVAAVAAGQPRMHAFCLPGHERHLLATA
ncbi:hypothetical protein FS842_005369, partial [Serendipita sp. 407]